MAEPYHERYRSALGDLHVFFDDQGALAEIALPGRVGVTASVGRRPAGAPPRSAVQRWFDQYLRGVQEPWPGAWRIPGETPFFHRVYRAVHRIPVGQTRSYGEIARQCGSPGAARAVGSAMARNPLPLLVPCHRVLAAGSRIGGFGCGVAMKRELLVREADAAGRPYPIQETTPPSQRPATNSA
ncbi:MAG TPA: methylated-DNA--[protein]-cysteine S-methyltransferase [Planctomycetota bacterium]